MKGITPALVGGIVGALLAIGLLLTMNRIAAIRVKLAERVAPYVKRHVSDSALLRQRGRTLFPTLERVLAPVMKDAIGWLDRISSSRCDVASRLRRAGQVQAVDVFRTQQVMWGLVGVFAGAGLAGVIGLRRGFSPVVFVLLVMVGGLIGGLARDWELTRQVQQRERRLTSQLPPVAEMLALAVGAGESPLAAFERISHITCGDLAQELSAVVADTRSGTPLVRALEKMVDHTHVPALARFAETIAVAIDRGTPLAEVIRAQANDAREASRRALMELGGRKEIGMMIPVVFLILPATVIIAIYPGLLTLKFGF